MTQDEMKSRARIDAEMIDPVERALLEAVAVRDAVFGFGDDDLVLLADALLCGIARVARRRRGRSVLDHDRLLAAA